MYKQKDARPPRELQCVGCAEAQTNASCTFPKCKGLSLIDGVWTKKTRLADTQSLPREHKSLEETDPNGVAQHGAGAKLDSGKVQAGVILDFSTALEAVAKVGDFGVNKYTRGGWQEVEDGIRRYTDASIRHLLAMSREEIDPDSGLPHRAHYAWNVLAVLELEERKTDIEEEYEVTIRHASPIPPSHINR